MHNPTSAPPSNQKSAIKSPSMFPAYQATARDTFQTQEAEDTSSARRELLAGTGLTLPEESERLSIVVVEDLLHGVNDWRNIQDIIRITFNALTEVVKNQSEAIRQLERNTATRQELASLAASSQQVPQRVQQQHDVQRALQEVYQELDVRVRREDLQALRSDLEFVREEKTSHEEVRRLIEYKANDRDTKIELAALSRKIEDFERTLAQAVNTSHILSSQLQEKGNYAEIVELLELKASKQTVSNALHRKANKAEVDAQLLRKVEVSDLQNLLASLESKAENSQLERVEAKVEDSLANQSAQLRKELEKVLAALNETRAEAETHLREGLDSIRQNFESLRESLESVRYQFSAQLSKKADMREVERLVLTESAKKIEEGRLNAVIQQFQSEITHSRRAIEESLAERLRRTDGVIEAQRDDFQQRLLDTLRAVDLLREEYTDSLRANSVQIRREFQRQAEELRTQNEQVILQLQVAIERKGERQELIDMRQSLIQQLEEKVDLSEVQAALNANVQEVGQRFSQIKEDFKTLLRALEQELHTQVAKRASAAELASQLAQHKQESIQHFSALVAAKAGTAELDDVRRQLEQLQKSAHAKLEEREFRELFDLVREDVTELQKEVLQRASIRDVCTLLDQKCAVDDVNKALAEIHRELARRASHDELNTLAADQAVINEQLCTENIVARWTWKSGELAPGAMVPWELQAANTLPDNFLWEKDKSNVLVLAPGLYEIQCGFFSKKKPQIQVLVNGEPILSAVNSSSYVLHHSSGKLKDLKHPSGNITGLSLIDFILLPARARLAVVFSGGDPPAEGFMGLKRL